MEHIHTPECRNLLAHLSDYIDGELDEQMCEHLRSHMQGCENCRVVFDTTTRTIYLYQTEADQTGLPDDVRSRLFNTLHLDDFIKPKPGLA